MYRKSFASDARGKTAAITFLAAVSAWAVLAQPAVDPAVPEAEWARPMWLARFDAKRELAATGRYDVVFFGDSITHGWEGRGRAVWAANFAEGPYRALNCGISGDRTEHVLWRLDHGQLAGAQPKAIVLMIGTNNTGHRKPWAESPTDTILGVQSILLRLRALCPDATVILHPIFPRGATTNDPMRVRNDLVNSVICKFADGKKTLWCDFNSKLLTPTGELTKEMAPDLVHPGQTGYEIWAAALKPYLDFALGRAKKAPKAAAAPAPTALAKTGKRTTTPAVKMHWLGAPGGKVAPRLRQKRAAQWADSERYYDVIMLGDSITHFWENDGAKRDAFLSKLGGYKILNLGFGGDHTENTLWNIRHGGFLDGVQTRVVTLMIGTNNAWGDSEEDIAAGIGACVQAIRERQPQAKVLLMPILPREVAHTRTNSVTGVVKDFRRKNHANVDEIVPKQTRVNEIIRPLADGEHVIWFDLTAKFTDREGLPDIMLLGDGTHPNAEGYAVWSAELAPVLGKLIPR